LRFLAKRRPSQPGGRRSSESLIGSSRVNVLHGPAGHWSREREGTGSVRGLGLTRQVGLGCVPRTGLLARSVLLLLVTTKRADLTVAPTPPLVNLVSLPFPQRLVAGYSCGSQDVRLRSTRHPSAYPSPVSQHSNRVVDAQSRLTWGPPVSLVPGDRTDRLVCWPSRGTGGERGPECRYVRSRTSCEAKDVPAIRPGPG